MEKLTRCARLTHRSGAKTRPWRRRGRRGVSDVIGTILLLALTLTLFSAVFLFVTTFPKPAPQPSAQFQATLAYGGSGGTKVVAINVNHLAGPNLLPATTQFYLFSQNATAAFGANPYHLSDGIAGVTQWVVGQVWSFNLVSRGISLFVPDNITVSIISNGILVYRQSIPGQNAAIPPLFLNQGTTPANPAVGARFTVFVQIQDIRTLSSVTLNFSQLPGVSGSSALPSPSNPGSTCNGAKTACTMVFNASNGLYQFVVPSGLTAATGTAYVFVKAIDSGGLNNSAIILVNIGSTGGGGGGGSGPVSVLTSVNPSLPVVGVGTTLVATLSNGGSSSGSVTVSFTVNGAAVGSASTVTLPAGGSTAVSDATLWSPTSVGTAVVTATISGLSSGSNSLRVTVFPKILLVAHSVPSTSSGFGLGNTSAALGTALSAAGIPFTLTAIPCGTSLSASVFTGYGVAIVDYGSNTTVATCFTSGIPSADQNAITGATSTNFWVVGEKAWSAASCSSYSSAFQTLFGLATLGTCTGLSSSALASVSYTAATPQGLLGAGMPSGASMTVDTTFNGLSAAAWTSSVATFKTPVGTTYLGASGSPVGLWATSSGQKGLGLGTDPALLKIAEPAPNGATLWGGGVAASLVYNVVNYLAGLSNSTSTGRVSVDFAVSHMNIVGTSHLSPSTFYVALRSNGPVGLALTVYLLVNGATGYYQGVVVSATITLAGNGDSQIATLTWEAPATGTYSLSAVIYPAGDVYAQNNQLPLSPVNLATTFT